MTLQDFQKNNDSDSNPDSSSENDDSDSNPDSSSENNDSHKVSN